MSEHMNQCDGCRAQMPVMNGIHQNGRCNHMACTADRYGHKPLETEKTVTIEVSESLGAWLIEQGFVRII